MSRTLNSIVGASLLAAVTLGISGCESSSTARKISWQSNGVPYYGEAGANTWHYKFVHYPESNVYYEPHSGTYYWKHNGLWQQGQDLPEQFYLPNEQAVVIRSKSELPYPESEAFAAVQ